jgi:hypothetical protein
MPDDAAAKLFSSPLSFAPAQFPNPKQKGRADLKDLSFGSSAISNTQDPQLSAPSSRRVRLYRMEKLLVI